MTNCLQYHYKIVRFKCYNNAEYGNSSSADSRLRTGGELAWTTTTIEMIGSPAETTVPPIGDRAVPAVPIRLPAEGNRIPNGDIHPTIAARPGRIAATRRKAAAHPVRIALIRRRIAAHPVRSALFRRRAGAPPGRIAGTRSRTGRTMARAALPPPVDRARRAPAAAILPLRGAHPAPAAAPAEAGTAVLPAIPAGLEKRKRNGNTSFAFNRASSL